jgi:preprotein translocase subunit SecD
MKQCRLAILSMALVLAASCAREPDVVLNLSVDTSSPAIQERTRNVLLARFDQVRPSFFSSVESKVDGSTISFRFKGAAPDAATMKYLSETPGRVQASLVETAEVLFTQRDIEHASTGYGNGGPVLNVLLAQNAGATVVAVTARNIGKKIRVTMDDRILLDAVISGAFGSSFQIALPGETAEQAKGLAAVLASGALPAPVSRIP